MRQELLVIGMAAACLAPLEPVPGQQRIGHSQALARLKSGNQRFVKGESLARPRDEGVRRTLARGQEPHAIILTSSDSRVVPEHVFNAGLGELFVVRTAGNVCDPHTLASIEHAAENLGTELCVVLAVEGCSAVRLAASASDDQGPPGGTHHSRPRQAWVVSQLAERIAPALRRARREGLQGEDMLARAEVENAHNTVLECLRRSRSLRNLRQAGRFRILAARYRSDGHVDWLPERPYVDRTKVRPRDPHLLQKLRGLSPQVALERLKAGHRRFLSPASPTGDISTERRQRMAASEEAIAVVVTCSDSRVAPGHLFDAGLGELYVVRVAGNAINDQALASIEYAVANTGASLCVVLGHSNCGMMATALRETRDARLSPSMRRLLHEIAPAVEIARQLGGAPGAPEDLQDRATRIHVLQVLARLRASRFLDGLEQEGRLDILPALYQIDTGDVLWLEDREVPSLPRSPAPRSVAPSPGGDTSPTEDNTLTATTPTSTTPTSTTPTATAPTATAPTATAPTHKTPEPVGRARSKASRRARALFLALLAAVLVASSCVLAILLWQRRSMTRPTLDAPGGRPKTSDARGEGYHDDYAEDYVDDYY